jgi:hypothetical protein
VSRSKDGSDPDRSFDPDRHIDALAPAMNLTITDAQRPGVIRFLTLAHEMASQLSLAPLDPETIDLAPTFCPGSRQEGAP